MLLIHNINNNADILYAIAHDTYVYYITIQVPTINSWNTRTKLALYFILHSYKCFAKKLTTKLNKVEILNETRTKNKMHTNTATHSFYVCIRSSLKM